MASPAKVAVAPDDPEPAIASEDASTSVAITSAEGEGSADASIESKPIAMVKNDAETKVRLKALRNLVSGGWASKKEIYSWYARPVPRRPPL